MAIAFGKAFVYSLIYFMGSIQFGFILNYNGLMIQNFKKDYPNWDYEKDSLLVDFFNNFASLFACIGGFIIHFFIRISNRRFIVSMYSLVNVVLWLVYFAVTPDRLILGVTLRCIQGVLNGGLVTITPILITENAPDDNTGMFGCINQAGIVVGMVVLAMVGVNSPTRTLTILCAIVNGLFACLIWLTPRDKAIEKIEPGQFKKNIAPIIIGMVMMLFQQFSGMNAILDNLVLIMSKTGIEMDSGLQSAIVQCAQLLSVLIASINMDGIGRKGMWIFSAVGIMIAQVLYLINLKASMPGWFGAVFVFPLQLFFGHGYGPIPWFICYDLFPHSFRTMGQSFVTFANMLSSFCVTYLFPVMKEKIGEFYTMVIFFCITFFAIPFGYNCIPSRDNKEGDGVTLI
ncbi:major facilitator superfamily transporter [Tritrichomonas foetus]|uniref:Major facilitator superfamily transporter n=1 Tax=Tritrichomonas foetus TaxID=1144522 RepID=A0A1J4KXH3_9EUKA|nr:major facilitator superfamily transporter [Tritrichomonas foetus]OHT15584.1 major facilitator superfamily transporter [Tritrichomonas foetus]|eukprot:OHT15583.1 major facilitator superfamily transporter [Tritrichomonas foetus]